MDFYCFAFCTFRRPRVEWTCKCIVLFGGCCGFGKWRYGLVVTAAVVKGRLQLWLAKDAVIPPGRGLDHILRTNRALRRDGDRADLGVDTWLADRRPSELIEAVRAQAPQLFD